MSRRNNVAFIEDCEEDSGSSIEGIASTRIYAVSEAPGPSPPKPQPNSSKSRSNDRYRPSPGRRVESSNSNSDSTTRSSKKGHDSKKEARRQREHDIMEDRRRKDEKRERDMRRQKAEERAAKESSKALKKIRPPPPRHSTTLPIVQQAGHRRNNDDPRAYGVQQPAVSGPRPRSSTRPASYYAGQPRPHPSNMGFPPGPGMPPPPFPVGTFPPPQMFHGGPLPGMPIPLPPPSPSNAPSYLDGPPSSLHGRDLRSRFEPRPSSAMGFSPSSRSYLHEAYDYDDEQPPQHMVRRPSHNRVHEDDRRKMPPPDFIPSRPRTTANPSTPFNAPPPRPASRHGQIQHRPKGTHRRSVGFNERPPYDDEDLFSTDDLFHDNSPEPNYHANRQSMPRSRHHLYEDEDDDDDDEYDSPPPVSHGRVARRGSMYTAALGSGGVSLERDRFLDAMRYQDDVNGGPQMPLTAETLRKASKRGEGASSRSTRSSESRDESEYKRSNTTGITRSSSGANDEYTIKVSGAAVVRIQGAEIECEDSEITVSNRPGASHAGSDRASTVYQLEDSRSRFERKALPHRPRAPSQSDSQSRYAPSHAPYEYAPYEPYGSFRG